jgi:outer membrane protein assembly factor BamB/photosystem II stability/assembly factor-like uncharacterized protein
MAIALGVGMSVRTRRSPVVLYALAMAVLLAACDWSVYGYNPAHTHASPETNDRISASEAPELGRAWTASTGAPTDTSPAVANGVAYIGSFDGKLYAYDASGSAGCSSTPKVCSPLWTGATGSLLYSSPAVDHGVVYVGSTDGKLYAFDADGASGCSGNPKTCAPLWTASTGGQIQSSPTVDGGRVYVGSNDSKLYVFDAGGSTGCSGSPKICAPLWTAPTGGAVQDSPAVEGGRVYVGSLDNKLYAFDAAGSTGCAGSPKVCSPLWTGATGGPLYSSPTVADGRVFIGSFDNSLYAFDAAGSTGCAGSPKLCSPLWRGTTGWHIFVSSPAIANGVVYIGSEDAKLYAFRADGSSGCSGSPKVCTPLWTATLAGTAAYSSPSIVNGTLFIGSTGAISAFDAAGVFRCSGLPKTCSPVWSASLGGYVHSSPAIANGTVYIGSQDGKLTAFSPRSRLISQLPLPVDAANYHYQGRAVAIDIDPFSSQRAVVASESGGLSRTTDGGQTWTHLDNLPVFRIADVRYSHQNAGIVIAATYADTHAADESGIWRSTDGGIHWSQPATARPSCRARPSAHSVGFQPDSHDVIVGTDCGLAVSHDDGTTWTHLSRDSAGKTFGRVTSVATPGQGVVQACGDSVSTADFPGGVRTSFDNGSTVGPKHLVNGGGCHYPYAPRQIAVAPNDIAVTFVTLGLGLVYESDNFGNTFNQIPAPSGTVGGREPNLTAVPAADGNVKHFDLYYGNTVLPYKQTCNDNAYPTCAANSWTSVPWGHADPMGFGFVGSCVVYQVNDGGIERSSNCGASFNTTHTGYNGLSVYQVTDQVQADHADVYFGTQDNSIWATPDQGASWPGQLNQEGLDLSVLHSTNTLVGHQVLALRANQGLRVVWDPIYANTFKYWTEPPPGGGGPPAVLAPGTFVEVGADAQLYVTTNDDGSWQPVLGASGLGSTFGIPLVSGPQNNPTIYVPSSLGLLKITGVLTGTATTTHADNGLAQIRDYVPGNGSFAQPLAIGVDPNNPNLLIAATTSGMEVTTNGGANWSTDANLMSAVTQNGNFSFEPGNDYGCQVHVISFDPANSQRIYIGTDQAGIIWTDDGGQHWSQLQGSEKFGPITAVAWDELRDVTYVSTYGRGIFKLTPAPAN